MKKRILASTMASVMALSAAGTSLVSFAANVDAEYKDQFTATKAELKKFVESKTIADLADNEAEQYGEISSERFMKAYDYAVAVLEAEFDGDTPAEKEANTLANTTAAFLMLKKAQEMLINHDKAELARLVEENRGIYNTNNELNPNNDDNEDMIYNEDDWDEFADAWEDADSLTSSNDLRDTTDAYEALAKAASNLRALDVKTKSELTKAMRNYEEALRDLEFSYQPWQRGTIKGSNTGVYKDKEVSWGAIYAHCKSGYAKIKAKYDDFDKLQLKKTSDPEIVAAVDAMTMATAVLTGFTADSIGTGNLRKAQSLLKDYQGRLVYDYNLAQAVTLFNDFVTVARAATTDGSASANTMQGWKNAPASAVTVGDNRDNYWYVKKSGTKGTEYKALGTKKTATIIKVLDAQLEVKHGNSDIIYCVLDKQVTLLNGEHPIVALSAAGLTGDDGAYFLSSASKPTVSSTTLYELVEIRKGRTFNISDHIAVTSTNIRDNGLAAYQQSFADALDTANANVTKAKNALYKSGTTPTGTIATAMTDLTAQIDACTGWATSALTGAIDSNVTNKKLADIQTAVRAVASKANDLKVALNTEVTTNAATYTSTDIDHILNDYDDDNDDSTPNLKTKYTLYKEACAAVASLVTDFKAAAAWDHDTDPDTADAKPTLGTGTAANPADPTNICKAVSSMASVSATALKTAEDAKTAATSNKATADGLDTTTWTEATWLYNNVYDYTDLVVNANAASKYGEIKVSDIKDKDCLVQENEDGSVSWAHLDFKFNPYVVTPVAGADHTCELTHVELAAAIEMIELMTADEAIENGNTHNDWMDIAESLDNINSIKDPDDQKKPSTKAWGLVNAYATYALADKYNESAAAKYSRSDVKKLIDDAYDLAEKTIETNMFKYSHSQLVTARKAANEWYSVSGREGLKDKDYTTTVNGKTSTDVYNDLNDKYKKLKAEYDGFKYSFGEIISKMRTYAEGVSKISDKAAAEKITTALGNVAGAILDVEVLQNKDGSEYGDYAVFTDDDLLDTYARVLSTEKGVDIQRASADGGKFTADKSSDDGKNKSHKALMDAVAALDKAYEDATKAPEKPTINYDVNGSGSQDPDINDVTALIDIVLGIKTVDDATKATYNFDGKGDVDINDVTKLINIVLGIESK